MSAQAAVYLCVDFGAVLPCAAADIRWQLSYYFAPATGVEYP